MVSYFPLAIISSEATKDSMTETMTCAHETNIGEQEIMNTCKDTMSKIHSESNAWYIYVIIEPGDVLNRISMN